jgi:hypothetical protein
VHALSALTLVDSFARAPFHLNSNTLSWSAHRFRLRPFDPCSCLPLIFLFERFIWLVIIIIIANLNHIRAHRPAFNCVRLDKPFFPLSTSSLLLFRPSSPLLLFLRFFFFGSSLVDDLVSICILDSFVSCSSLFIFDPFFYLITASLECPSITLAHN